MNGLTSCPADSTEFKQSILSHKLSSDFAQQAIFAEIHQHLRSLLLRLSGHLIVHNCYVGHTFISARYLEIYPRGGFGFQSL